MPNFQVVSLRLMSGFVLCLCTLAQVPAQAAQTTQPTFSIRDTVPLGQHGFYSSDKGLFNDQGDLAGNFQPSGEFVAHCFLYKNSSGEILDLGIGCFPLGLGKAGHIFGSLSAPGQGFFYNGAQMGFMNIALSDMNDFGWLAGTILSDNASQAVMVLRGDLIALTPRDRFSGLDSRVNVTSSVGALNNNGQVVGSLIFYPDHHDPPPPEDCKWAGRLCGINYGFFTSASGGINVVGPVGGGQLNFGAVRHTGISMINNAGLAVGVSVTLGGPNNSALFTFDGGVHNLGNLGGGLIVPRVLNEAGQIAGVADRPDGTMHGFFYEGKGGGLRDMGAIGDGDIRDINERGDVVGEFSSTGGNHHAFLYSGNRLRDLGTLAPDSLQRESRPRDINNQGNIVGFSCLAAGCGVTHAFLHDGTRMWDLNNIVAVPAGWTLTDAAAINDAGEIAAVGVLGDGPEQHIFILTPTTPVWYFALGDSIAAGHGLAGASEDCKRSPLSYPHLVADSLRPDGLILAADVTCSGAKTYNDLDDAIDLSRQVDEVLAWVEAHRQPGVQPKVVVSLTIGANDFPWAVDFSKLAQDPSLVTAQTLALRDFLCKTDSEYATAVASTVNSARLAITSELRRLRVQTNARIVITEVHNPINPTGGGLPLALGALCHPRFIDPYQRFEDASASLSVALRQVVDDLGADVARSARIHSDFKNHYARVKLCGLDDRDLTGKSWIQQDFDNPKDGADCFHPNTQGASQYAGAVIKEMRNLLRNW